MYLLCMTLYFHDVTFDWLSFENKETFQRYLLRTERWSELDAESGLSEPLVVADGPPKAWQVYFPSSAILSTSVTNKVPFGNTFCL